MIEQVTQSITFNGNAAPTYAAGTTVADLLKESGQPTVYKRSDWSGPGNPIQWRIAAADGTGSGLYTVAYRLEPPAAAATAYVPATAVSGGGATHGGEANPTLSDSLRTVAGVWSIRFQLTDRVGRVTECAFDWRHEPLAPAVSIAPVALSTWDDGTTLAAQNLFSADLITVNGLTG